MTLLAATCWRWSGVHARALSVEQAAAALESLEMSAIPVTLARLMEMIGELERVAKTDSAAGDAARHALDKLRTRLTR